MKTKAVHVTEMVTHSVSIYKHGQYVKTFDEDLNGIMAKEYCRLYNECPEEAGEVAIVIPHFFTAIMPSTLEEARKYVEAAELEENMTFLRQYLEDQEEEEAVA